MDDIELCCSDDNIWIQIKGTGEMRLAGDFFLIFVWFSRGQTRIVATNGPTTALIDALVNELFIYIQETE